MGRGNRILKLSGVYAAAVTPNRAGTLEADHSALLDLMDFLADGGVDGICLMGSTGEFVNYSSDERQRAVHLASKRSRVPVVVGVAHSSLTGALRLAGEAIASGADGLLLMPPYFFPYRQPEIEAFYRAFMAELGPAIPVLLYNIPQFTSPIHIGTAQRLLDTGLFAGIKDSSGDWAYFEQLLALRREREFALFAGNDRIALQALRAGADGVLSGCASAIPELLSRLYRTHAAGNGVEADSAHERLMEFVEQIEQFPVPVGIKRAVQLRGQKSGVPSVPLGPETKLALDSFEPWFREWASRSIG